MPNPDQRSFERATMNLPEVAQVLGISRTAAYRWAAKGIIPTIRIGRRVVAPLRAVEAMLGSAPVVDPSLEREAGSSAPQAREVIDARPERPTSDPARSARRSDLGERIRKDLRGDY